MKCYFIRKLEIIVVIGIEESMNIEIIDGIRFLDLF